METATRPLSGCTLWLARPSARSTAWQEVLSAAGAEVIVEPLIDIAPAPDTAIARAALAEAETADIVIATSAHAVAGIEALVPDWQPSGHLLAVGEATASAFSRHTGRAVTRPPTFDSEGVLAALDDKALAGRRVALLAGEGGRTLLADTLGARGARVTKAVLYRRLPVAWSAERLRARLVAIDVLVITSDGAWQALRQALAATDRSLLAHTRLVAASARVVQLSQRDIDWQHTPTVIETMTPAGALAAVTTAWQGEESPG